MVHNFVQFYKHELLCCIGRMLFMKLNNKLMLGFQKKNQSCLHIKLRNYQFMYTVCDLLKV